MHNADSPNVIASTKYIYMIAKTYKIVYFLYRGNINWIGF